MHDRWRAAPTADPPRMDGVMAVGAEKARKRQTDLGARRRQLTLWRWLRRDGDPSDVAPKRQEKGNLRACELRQVAGTSRKMLLFAPESGR